MLLRCLSPCSCVSFSVMGGKNNKPVHRSAGGGGGAGIDETTEKPFHSKEFMQAELDLLLQQKERLTWDEFKEQQKKKGEMEGAESRLEEEAQRRFRQELDEARSARLAAAGGVPDEPGKKSKKDKKHSKKHKKEKDKKEKDHKKKRRRSSSSSSDDSDSEEDQKRRKKSKKDKKDKSSKDTGPVSLRDFFAASSDEDND